MLNALKKRKITIRNKPKVFMMMSGGVDSSVAAFLLAKSGKYEVIGCFIKGYNIDGCQKKDAQDARRTAEHLGIPFYVIDLEKDYKKLVVDYMINGYKKGITPNPDVMCNKEIKFGLFLKKVMELGAPACPAYRTGRRQAGIYVATGHYVRLGQVKSKKEKVKRDKKIFPPSTFHFQLFAAKDKNKDQSYFLWTLTQEQLKHCLFPIGDYFKSEVRKIAQKAGLPTAAKKDSQGICFLGMFKFSDFLEKFLPIKKGDIITTDGKKIGTHKGVWFYTIGQRHLGVDIKNKKSSSKPFYVVDKDAKKNVLIVTEGDNNLALYKKEIKLTNVNFVSSLKFQDSRLSVLVRLRYRQPLGKAKIFNLKPKTCTLQFDKPVKFVAPGQSAVMYNFKGELLGGGIIEK